MNGLLYPVERVTRVGVDLIKATAKRRVLMAVIGLTAIMLIAGGYIAVSGLRVNPARRTMSVRVLLEESGGLLANQDVTVRGIPVGRITAVNLTEHGVEAVAEINSRTRIPRDSPVRVSGLSAAGEQYLDFRPERGGGPYLTDGTVISESQTTIPMSLAHIIDDSHGALAQLEPEKIKTMLSELRVSRDGASKLASILDGSIFLSSTLAGVLPQTVSMLRNTGVLFNTLADTNAGLRRTSLDLQNVLGGVNAMDGGFRTLVDNGAGQAASIDNLLSDNRDSIVALLENMTTVSRLLYLRVPALQNLWRPDHESLIDHISTIFHDNGIWAIGHAYPHYACDYNLPRHSPMQVDSPEPYRYTYCNNPDPSVLVRGARNAPRPPDDDTAGPPADYDPLATTDPTPFYPPYTLPTPFGGPQLPAWVPN